ALAVSGIYAATDVWSSQAAGVAGIATAIVINYLASRFGLRTRRATNPSAVLLTRNDSAEYLD
ncbi:MAG: hypothetical protein RL623_1269, partial [Actinomycetota bacterium]